MRRLLLLASGIQFKTVYRWSSAANVSVLLTMCVTDRRCSCTEEDNEGAARLQRVILSQALQVCKLFQPKKKKMLASYIQSFGCCSCCDNLTWTFYLMQESLEELMAQKHWYGDRDDFTVVLQESVLITHLPSVPVSHLWTMCLNIVSLGSREIVLATIDFDSWFMFIKREICAFSVCWHFALCVLQQK